MQCTIHTPSWSIHSLIGRADNRRRLNSKLTCIESSRGERCGHWTHWLQWVFGCRSRCSGSLSCGMTESPAQSSSHLAADTINQSVSQSVSQSVNQPNNQSIHQSINQSIKDIFHAYGCEYHMSHQCYATTRCPLIVPKELAMVSKCEQCSCRSTNRSSDAAY